MKISAHLLVSVLIWRKPGLLLLRRRRNFQELDTGKGLWELPGGKLKLGEWPVKALRREIREETDWKISRKFRYRNYIFYRLKTEQGSAWRLQLLYNARLQDKKLAKPELGAEHDAYKYIQTAAELNALTMLPEVKRYLLIALTGQVWIEPENVPQ